MATDQLLEVPRLETDLAPARLLELRPPALARLAFTWDGRSAPPALHTTAWLGWTAAALYAYFECGYQSLNLSPLPKRGEKTIGLWERDVVEIFIAPDPGVPNHYREVEVSPLGEWVDVGLRFEGGVRHSDWDWRSGIEAASEIDAAESVWRAGFKVPSEALFGAALEAGRECAGNLYRCDGREPARNYLTWRPTLTPAPNFHVPERFGRLRFIN